MISAGQLADAPKVLLHDHLDGGLRPATIVELAAEIGHQLPRTDAGELGQWFVESADSGSLPRYLETFDHTVAVMQNAEAITRVASECVQDLAADGVVYAEIRYAPEQHLTAGLSPRAGRRCGRRRLRARYGHGRAPDRRAPAPHRDAPPGPLDGDRRALGRLSRRRGGRLRHRRRRGGVPAHPAPGRVRVPAARERPLHHPRRRGVRPAVDLAGDPVVRRGPARPRRTDHRRHLVRPAAGLDGKVELGRLAAYVRDRRIPLEMCPSSNLQTGAADSIAQHPIGLLAKLKFRVTVNTDNRLMSGTSMSRELALLAEAFDYGLADFRWFAINAMKSAFIPFDERLAIIDNIIKPWYAEALA